MLARAKPFGVSSATDPTFLSFSFSSLPSSSLLIPSFPVMLSLPHFLFLFCPPSRFACQAVSNALNKCTQPLYARIIADMALSWASDTKPPVLATTTPQLIKQRLEQIEAGCGQVVTAACFSYIALSRFGLTRQELLDVLSLDNGAIKAYGTANMPEGISRFPFVRLALWQHMAGSLIEMVETDGGCLLCIASTAVLDAVQARYLAVAKAAAARTLCDYWSGRWAGTPKQLGQGVATNRLVPEQVTTRRFSICSGFEIIRACVCVCVDAMGSFLHQEKKSPSELCVPGHLFLHVGSAPLHALALMGDDQPLLFDGPVPRENVRALYELPHALVAGGDVEGLDHHVCFDFAFLQRFLQRAPVPEAIALIMQANEFVLGHKAARGVVFVLMVVVPFCSVFGDEHAHTNKHAQTLFLSFSLSLSLFLSFSLVWFVRTAWRPTALGIMQRSSGWHARPLRRLWR